MQKKKTVEVDNLLYHKIMSKIANKPLEILSDVKFNIKDNNISIEGPKGKLEFVKPDDIMIELNENIVKASTKSELTAMSGTTRTHYYQIC